MDGRGRASRRAAWVAVVLAAGCGSSSNGPKDAAQDAAKDAAQDAARDAPAPEVDPCPGAHEPGCGLLSPERVDDCVYALPAEPQVPTNVGVFFVSDGGSMRIPHDQQDLDGWDYVDSTATSIRLYGTWCDKDRSGVFGTLNVFAGCSGCIP
jgi:hypothetical protein